MYQNDPNGTASARWPQPESASLPLVLQFKRVFSAYHRSGVLTQLVPEVAEFYNRREETLLRLEELHRRILFDTDEQRRARDRETNTAQREPLVYVSWNKVAE